MTDANRIEKEHPNTDMDKQSTNPTWALGLIAFSFGNEMLLQRGEKQDNPGIYTLGFEGALTEQ